MVVLQRSFKPHCLLATGWNTPAWVLNRALLLLWAGCSCSLSGIALTLTVNSTTTLQRSGSTVGNLAYYNSKMYCNGCLDTESSPCSVYLNQHLGTLTPLISDTTKVRVFCLESLLVQLRRNKWKFFAKYRRFIGCTRLLPVCLLISVA